MHGSAGRNWATRGRCLAGCPASVRDRGFVHRRAAGLLREAQVLGGCGHELGEAAGRGRGAVQARPGVTVHRADADVAPAQRERER